MSNTKKSFLISIFTATILLAALIYFLHSKNTDYDLVSLLIGDGFLAIISLFSFFTIDKGLKSTNPHAFIRAKYTGTLVKFFSCITLLLVYIFSHNKEVHKPSLFLFLGMYVVFSALEAIPLSKMAKIKQNE